MLSDGVGQRVADFRRERGMRREDLAQRVAEVTGDPAYLSAPTIGNIETGRPGSDGIRRRTVSVDELLVLAKALDVMPIQLLLPTEPDESVEIIPSQHVAVFKALRWLKGDDPFPGDEKNPHVRLAIRGLRTIGRFIDTRDDYNLTVAALRTQLRDLESYRADGDEMRIADTEQDIEISRRNESGLWDQLTLTRHMMEALGITDLAIPSRFSVPLTVDGESGTTDN